MVCTYKLFTGKHIWKYQTGEIPPFWCTNLISTRAYVYYFMPPVIFDQEENYTQDIHWNLPSDWIVHNTSSRYMERDGWTKVTSLFSSTCGDRNINPQILFFNIHERRFYERTTHLLWYHHIYPFIIKVDNYTNDNPNDNGPNLKIKRYHGIAKVKW